MFTTLLNTVIALLLSLLAPIATLSSLERVDDYPLYVMHYYGDPERNVALSDALLAALDQPTVEPPIALNPVPAAWGCSLFATWADPANALYGRNFDWQLSPALLLFNHPPDGYDSVMMVTIIYSGFSKPSLARQVDSLPLLERTPLLFAPNVPMDGMNEHGLAIAHAAVSNAQQPYDPDLPMISSVTIEREVLTHARTVEEALAIFARYNIEWTGGPDLHYLVADATGNAALIEFVGGEMIVTQHPADWEMATNFTRAPVTGDPEDQCWRYKTISTRLAETGGLLSMADAMTLLSDVAQPSTQWSVVYGMTTGEIRVALLHQYDPVYTFHLGDAQ